MKSTILVVEDEVDIRKNIKRVLEFNDYQVYDAPNGAVGLNMAKKHKPDLIISDIMMPELDGFGLLKELQKETEFASIPFLFLSAKSERTDVREGMKFGADDYLTKPFDIQDLIAAVEARLKKKSATEHQFKKRIEDLRSTISRSLPHELRTPLSLILGFSDYLIKHYDTTQPKDALEMLNNIYDSGKRLNRIFENYLFYANLENLSASPVDINNLTKKKTFSAELLLRDTVNVYSERAARKDDFMLNLEDASLKMSNDYFAKLVEEIIDNCVKFSEPGTKIEINSKKVDMTFHIDFTDYGRGMTQDHIDNIGAYMQFERKIHEQQGAGLGIFIVKKLVELHSGEFLITSQTNKFTTISIKLPIY
ncbi:MAG: response regulator receiver sensor signal transduction histidine kinase [Ignavibacteria bacterium]|nr:response regulator receiver sensor signal transduction histidine kinase [Ignavibacteria bacterium]